MSLGNVGGDAMIAADVIKHGTAKDMQCVAERLESDNPLWIVVFGVYTRQFVAFPRFAAPEGTVITAGYPGALSERMRRVEHLARVLRAMKTESAALPPRRG
jgi:hypothetical protein